VRRRSEEEEVEEENKLWSLNLFHTESLQPNSIFIFGFNFRSMVRFFDLFSILSYHDMTEKRREEICSVFL
jgi:hypothetical protein